MIEIIEVCVSSRDDAVAAVRAGANRIELCAALEVGGLTPSLGMVEGVVAAVDVPVVVMLRPRVSGFHYSACELAEMERDAEHVLRVGAAGIVFGCLTTAGEIDIPAVRRFVAIAAGKETVFHRAFDFVPDPIAALDALIALGVTRVLTSGGAVSAVAAVDRIDALITHSAGRIQILPGGGIRGANVFDFVQQTGCTAVHLGPSTANVDPSLQHQPDLNLSDLGILQQNAFRRVDPAAIELVVASLSTR